MKQADTLEGTRKYVETNINVCFIATLTAQHNMDKQ